jgi:hypothetical protein
MTRHSDPALALLLDNLEEAFRRCALIVHGGPMAIGSADVAARVET